MRRLATLALAAVLATALVACGDDDATTTAADQPSSSTTTETTSTTSTTSTDETGLPQERCKGAEFPPNIVNVVSYGTDCGAVEDAMAEIESVSDEFRIGDFQCARTSGSSLSGTWTCKGEASYFTFDFGD